MINYDLIPQFMIDKGVSLRKFGIFEYAWMAKDINEIIDILYKKKIPILGGDVYKMSNGQICQTYDSWYINASDECDFYIKSYEKAMLYILDYEERNEGQFFYTIVY